MTCDCQKSVQMRSPPAATFLPPTLVEETGWDLLLALYSDQHFKLSLGKLGALVSVPRTLLIDWLARLEAQHLVTGAMDTRTGEIWAALTAAGENLLDKYLSATSDLQVGAHH